MTQAPGTRRPPRFAIQPNLRSGQAMVEMVVAMVVIVVMLVGLLHIARLAMAHTEAMHDARREAGEYAMQQVPTWANPSFILDWNAGPDGATYSRDDILQSAAASEFTTVIPAAAQPQELNVLRPGNPVSTIAALSSPQYEFHMVRGDAVRTVSSPPAVQNLIYGADSIDVHGEVWMIYTRGID